MQKEKSPNKEKNTSNNTENQEKIPETIDLPSEAVENGFTNLSEWKNAQINGFTNFDNWQEALHNGFNQFSEWDNARKGGFKSFTDWNNAMKNGFTEFEEWNNAKLGGFTTSKDWEKAKQAGFKSFGDWSIAKNTGFEIYDDWINAKNEGFDTKEDWDDWVSIKESGFSDVNLFYESKDIGFYQNSLRKAFLKNLKLAKKGGFNSIQTWKEAEKWNINDFDEWQFVNALSLQNVEEYELVKELQKKCLILLDELYPNQEISLNRIVEIFAEDYTYTLSKTAPTDKVYKNFTRARFENLLLRTIKQIAIDSDIYKYSRLNNSVLKVAKEKFTESTQSIKLTKSNDITCPNCLNKISKTTVFCPECGTKVEKCPICQSALADGSIGNCPHCCNSFHLNHLQEVIKISGKCPICKHELKEFDIL